MTDMQPWELWLIAGVIVAMVWIGIMIYRREMRMMAVDEALQTLLVAMRNPETAYGAVYRSITRGTEEIGIAAENDNQISRIRLSRCNPALGSAAWDEPMILRTDEIKVKLRPGTNTFQAALEIFRIREDSGNQAEVKEAL